MNLTLPLTAEEEAKLLAKACAEGTTPENLVRQAIEQILAALPQVQKGQAGPRLAAARIRELAKGKSLGGATVRQLIDEGRRF